MAISPLSALNQFHREMQLTKKLYDDRKTVLRPKLLPGEYTILSMALVFNSDTSGKCRGEWVESPYDIPLNARNPDLRKSGKRQEESLMPFMETIQDGRLAE